MADDPFASLFAEAGPIAPSQLAYINNNPFLHDTTLPPPPPPPPPPVEVPTVNCALAQAQAEPELEPEPESIQGLGFDEQAPPPPPLEMAGVGNDVVVEEPEPEKRSGLKRAPGPKPKPAPAPKAASAVDPLLQAVSLMAGKLDPNLENKDILEICAMKGIFFAPPRWHRPGGYEKKKDQE